MMIIDHHHGEYFTYRRDHKWIIIDFFMFYLHHLLCIKPFMVIQY